MSDLRTPEVEDLLRVFAALDDEDVIFSLLEDLFTIREIKETSQRLAVARQLDAGKSYSASEEATGASATRSEMTSSVMELMVDTPHARPSSPSMRLTALVMATIQMTVAGMDSQPRFQ